MPKYTVKLSIGFTSFREGEIDSEAKFKKEEWDALTEDQKEDWLSKAAFEAMRDRIEIDWTENQEKGVDEEELAYSDF